MRFNVKECSICFRIIKTSWWSIIRDLQYGESAGELEIWKDVESNIEYGIICIKKDHESGVKG